ncbi:MAG: glycine cleavage system protein GcvH [Verrucomicrobiota bacterium]
MNVPDGLQYTDDHEWVDTTASPSPVGITDHAQEELSELVYVELPEIGTEVEKGDGVAVVESVKAASDIYAPVSGKIVEINEALTEDPTAINKDPYGEGWIFKIKVTGDAEDLLDAEGYKGAIG